MACTTDLARSAAVSGMQHSRSANGPYTPKGHFFLSGLRDGAIAVAPLPAQFEKSLLTRRNIFVIAEI
jgi:hypothetical protein